MLPFICEFRIHMLNILTAFPQTSYPFEDDDPLLVVFIGGDVKHGASITGHDVVLYFGIFPDVQVMGFDSTDSRSHCRRLGDSYVKETC